MHYYEKDPYEVLSSLGAFSFRILKYRTLIINIGNRCIGSL